MLNNIEKNKWNTVIIGAGQAGLATGYYLSKKNIDFIIIDKCSKIGDSWRKRWDSLQLFTPSQYDGLPGLKFSMPKDSFPTNDEMADYLEKYVKEFSLLVKFNTEIFEISKITDDFEIVTSNGMIIAKNLVIATGTNQIGKIPEFTQNLNKDIFQIHSSQYKNPQSLPNGKTLVVGAGTSGVEIAIELSKSRETFISGKPTPHIPDPIFRYAGGAYWWFISNILTTNTPIGKKVKGKILKEGAPLIRVSFNELKSAGVKPLPRVIGVQDGLPKLQNGEVISVSSIVWSTGYKPDFSWLNLDAIDKSGWPDAQRGISNKINGLYFVGMLFQFGLTSGLVGGVGRDAAFVVEQIIKKYGNN